MEPYFFKLFYLADKLNLRQNKVFAEILYRADDNKTLEIYIRLKKNFKYVESCKIQLKVSPEKKLEMISDLFSTYVGGDIDE